MKEILTEDLEVDDIYFYKDRYWIVISVLLTIVRSKCIMGPTIGLCNIGDYSYLYKFNYDVKVKLLVRNGRPL